MPLLLDEFFQCMERISETFQGVEWIASILPKPVGPGLQGTANPDDGDRSHFVNQYVLEQAPPGGEGLDLATVEATSVHTVSTVVAVAALARAESRGCHRWRDVPAASDKRARHTVLHVREGQLRVAVAATAGIGASA